MKSAKFPTELEETKLIDTDGYTLVSDAEGQAKKMRPSVTHTRATYGDGSVGQTTNLLTEDGKYIVNVNKTKKNNTMTHDEVQLSTAEGNNVVSAYRDKDADKDNTTHDEVQLSTAEGNDVVYAYRDQDAGTGNTTHDEVQLSTAEGNNVVSAYRNQDADTGNTTHDEVHLLTAEGNDVVYAYRNLTDDSTMTHDEVCLRTADGNDVVKCERDFDANGNETDKKTTLHAKSLKSLKVDTSSDGTFSVEQLACGSGRVNGTVHQITSATQTIDIQGETISVFEIDASMSATSITVTLQNVPKSNDPNVLLGGRVVVVNNGQVNATVAVSATGLTGGIGCDVNTGETISQQFFTMSGKFFG